MPFTSQQHNINNSIVHVTKMRNKINNSIVGAVVVAQLVERSHPTPEVRGSNPVIGKLLNIKNSIVHITKKKH